MFFQGIVLRTFLVRVCSLTRRLVKTVACASPWKQHLVPSRFS